jgi:hypothetical protein
MSKAAWQIFTHLQQKVDDQISLYLNSINREPPTPRATPEEQWIENTLDPTRSFVDSREI